MRACRLRHGAKIASGSKFTASIWHCLLLKIRYTTTIPRGNVPVKHRRLLTTSKASGQWWHTIAETTQDIGTARIGRLQHQEPQQPPRHRRYEEVSFWVCGCPVEETKNGQRSEILCGESWLSARRLLDLCRVLSSNGRLQGRCL